MAAFTLPVKTAFLVKVLANLIRLKLHAELLGGMHGDFTAASIGLKRSKRPRSSKVFPGQSRVRCEGLRHSTQRGVTLDLAVKHLVNEPLDSNQSWLPNTAICCLKAVVCSPGGSLKHQGGLQNNNHIGQEIRSVLWKSCQ